MTKKDWKTIVDKEVPYVEPKEDRAVQDEMDDFEEDDEGGGAGSDNGGVLDHPSYKVLEEKLTEAEQKAHENWDKAVRAVAELDNLTRRAERDIESAHKYSTEKFASALLPVIDSLEQALLVDTDSDAVAIKVHEGVELTLKLLLDVLQKFAIEQMDPVHKPFDPQYHEAISIQEHPELPPNTVIEVFQKGYLLNGRVIRAARVIVTKG